MKRFTIRELSASQPLGASISSDSAERVKWWMDEYFDGEPARFSSWLRGHGFARPSDLANRLSGTIDPSPDQSPCAVYVNSANRGAYANSPNKLQLPGLQAALWPYVSWAELEIEQILASTGLDQTSGLKTSLVSQIASRLYGHAKPTIYLTMHIAVAEMALASESLELQIEEYSALLLRRDRFDIFARFPALDRFLTHITTQTVNAVRDLALRFSRDAQYFMPAMNVTGTLSDIEIGMGDPHAGGRTVCALFFSCGKKIIYKPRDIQIDRAYSEYIDWYNTISGAQPLAALSCFEGVGYGWIEYATSNECSSRAEVGIAFFNMGMLFALLDSIRSTDMHFENIVFDSTMPHVVDIECTGAGQFAMSGSTEIARLRRQVVLDSPLAVGYLPHPQDLASGIVDVSAGNFQRRTVRTTALDPDGGEMPEDREVGAIQKGAYAPRLGGVVQKLVDHEDDFVTGFRYAMRILARSAKHLVSDGGPLKRLRDASIRYVPQSTRVYAAIMRRSLHPSVMCSVGDRQAVIGGAVHSDKRPTLYSLIQIHEENDLFRGDIPYFSSKVSGSSLFCSDGTEVPNFFSRSGWDLIRCKFLELDELAIDRASWEIRSALAAGRLSALAKPPHELAN